MAGLQSQHLRIFIACALPATVRGHLAEVQACLKQTPLSLRWVKTDQIHLTLKFIGSTPAERVKSVAADMQQAASGRGILRLQTKGLGVFPTLKRPRVLWMGLDGDLEDLAALQADLDQALEELDPKSLPRSRRPYRGHLTLGRARGRLAAVTVVQALRGCGDYRPVHFEVDRVILYQSELRPTGAVYTALTEAKLG